MITDLSSLGLTVQEQRTFLLISYIISSIITIGIFILKAIAIKTLAKNKGFDKLYLAWIPFLNYVLLGKVVGTCFLFRKKVKNIGILVAITSIIGFIVFTLLNVGAYVYDIEQFLGAEINFNSTFITNWVNAQGLAYVIVYYVYYAFSFVEIILKASLIFFIFRKYAPERAFIYMLVAIFFDFMFGVLLFVIRNRNASNYDDFLRTRVRADYSYYDPNSQYSKNPESDPFPEFRNNQIEGTETNSSDNKSSDDDLFN